MRNVDNVGIFFSVHSHRAKAERKAKKIYEQAKRIKKKMQISKKFWSSLLLALGVNGSLVKTDVQYPRFF